LPLHILSTPTQQIGAIIMLLVFGYAQWKGGRVERGLAWAMLAAYIATPFAASLTSLFAPRLGVMAVDAVLLAVVLTVALRSDRYWPMAACAFLSIELVMHFTILFDHHVMPKAYIIATHIWSYPVLLSLVFGAWSADRRRKRERSLGRHDAPVATGEVSPAAAG
jgi:hypothetical protein